MELHRTKTILHLADYHARGTRQMAAQIVVYPTRLCGYIPIQYIAHRTHRTDNRTSPRTLRDDAHICLQIPLLLDAIWIVGMVDTYWTAFRLRGIGRPAGYWVMDNG